LATRVKLVRILSPRNEAATIVRDLIDSAGAPLAVRDPEGQLLLGSASAEPDELSERHPVLCDGEVVGWVSGGAKAARLATLLSCLAAREAEKEILCDEVLDLYREINLLYNLSEKLAASLELATVARLVLDEASRLIEGTGGAVLLRDERTEAYEPAATYGRGIAPRTEWRAGDGVIGRVATSARAEIVNDARADTGNTQGQDAIRSLICAPLKSKDRASGAIVLVSEVPVTYTAADLNLLNTVASQAAPAVENALLYERALREAQERAERLQRQIDDLRIELDEARQRQKLTEIVESDYFRRLREQADHLRDIVDGN
jgi:transcriptional regulator with GAF, ATPase, and Fis domain